MSDFWATLIGSAFGVVAGALIQYVVQIFIDRSVGDNQKNAFKKEMQCNANLITELLAETVKLRNAVNGDALPSYCGYFNYEKGLFAQANALVSNGTLYRWFSIDNLKKIQELSFRLNLANTNVINPGITERRLKATSGQGYSKQEAVQYVDLIENQLNALHQCTQQILTAIDQL